MRQRSERSLSVPMETVHVRNLYFSIDDIGRAIAVSCVHRKNTLQYKK